MWKIENLQYVGRAMVFAFESKMEPNEIRSIYLMEVKGLENARPPHKLIESTKLFSLPAKGTRNEIWK